jgi:hypothetical protein
VAPGAGQGTRPTDSGWIGHRESLLQAENLQNRGHNQLANMATKLNNKLVALGRDSGILIKPS